MTPEEKIVQKIRSVLQRHSDACAAMEANFEKDSANPSRESFLNDILSAKTCGLHRVAIAAINRIVSSSQ